jgi:iron complex outermembrane receptor protein
LETLIESLHSGGYSCVIRKGDETRTFRQRGVKDLWELCQSQDLFLNGAIIADKVVGKGAAALMILGGIKEVYADVISTPAVDLLKEHGIKTSFNETTDRIINRQGNGLCPVETLCINLQSVNEMYEVITNFIKQNR